ncbi:aspartate--tRNA ligase, partial [Staphylococcus pseudintermedius]|nr:aspartate--tRNA ligase [Staphylococcus pseudintermedius]
MAKRTTYCGSVTEELLEQEVTLKGWVHNRRDLGGLIFVDVRDREGYVQVVFNPAFSKEALEVAERIRSEYVVEITGTVTKRDDETINPKIKTGQVEVQAKSIEIINQSETPPFSINEENLNVDENIRLKYRYLDLRREKLAQTFKMRHQITRSIRQFLDGDGFYDVE